MNSDSYTHTTAHAELDGFRYDPVNLDRYIPLWRRIWWLGHRPQLISWSTKS